MSVITSVSVFRNGEQTPRSTGNLVQLDDVSLYIQALSGGSIPENTFTLYSMVGIPDIQLSDLLIDECYRDPKTNTPWQYRVRGTPDLNYGAYLSVQVDRTAGS
jgi:hypothetical protein